MAMRKRLKCSTMAGRSWGRGTRAPNMATMAKTADAASGSAHSPRVTIAAIAMKNETTPANAQVTRMGVVIIGTSRAADRCGGRDFSSLLGREEILHLVDEA